MIGFPLIQSPLGLPHFLLLGLFLFSLGLYGLLTTRNSLRFLMAFQLLLLAAVLCFTAFSDFLGPATFNGQAMAVLSCLGAIAFLLFFARGNIADFLGRGE